MRLLRDEHGSVLVEVALVLPVLAAILVGAVDYGLLLERRMRVQNAAAAALAYATANSEETSLRGAQRLALEAVAGMERAQATSQQYWTCTPGGNHVRSRSHCGGEQTPMQWVEINVFASGAPLMSFPGLSANNTLHVRAIGRVQWMP